MSRRPRRRRIRSGPLSSQRSRSLPTNNFHTKERTTPTGLRSTCVGGETCCVLSHAGRVKTMKEVSTRTASGRIVILRTLRMQPCLLLSSAPPTASAATASSFAAQSPSLQSTHSIRLFSIWVRGLQAMTLSLSLVLSSPTLYLEPV